MKKKVYTPLYRTVMVQCDPPKMEEVSKGGIVLPQDVRGSRINEQTGRSETVYYDVQDLMRAETEGTVIAMGPLCGDCGFKVGDRVQFERYCGESFTPLDLHEKYQKMFSADCVVCLVTEVDDE